MTMHSLVMETSETENNGDREEEKKGKDKESERRERKWSTERCDARV